MYRRTSNPHRIVGFMVCIVVLLLVFPAQPIKAQPTAKAQVNNIRKEYLKINAELKSSKKTDVRWEAGEANPGYGTNYTGYFNPSNKLVLLKFTHGEEGYWASYEYYFKNGDIIFIYIHSGEPDGSEKQERIYFANERIVQALIKVRPAGEERKIDDLGNKPHESIMNNVDESTRTYLNGVESELKLFNEALK